MGSLSSPGRRAGAVQARGVGFRYPTGRIGLEPLDLDVGPGEVLVLIGPNGSGKSTLLKLLATALRPTSGSLTLLGRPADPPGAQLRRRIGYAADHPIHLEPLTGLENLRFFMGISGAEPATAEAEGTRLLESLGLEEAGRVPVAEYSFGMRRRLLLAEALAHLPDLLLLDEPTVGLDPEGTAALEREVRRRASAGAAVVLATNEIHQAPRWATRILFLHRARAVADAAPEALMGRLRGRTRIEITFVGDPPSVEQWPEEPGTEVGLEPSEPGRPEERPSGEGILVVESTRGGRPLPALLARLLDGGIEVRSVRVREPDLGDLFRELTGEALVEADPQRTGADA